MQAKYTPGQVGVEQLLAAVPQAKDLTALRGEQIANIGSQNMNDEVLGSGKARSRNSTRP